MKKIFRIGDQKQCTFIVKDEDVAAFTTGVVHHVYSTFALARDAEWTTRQFVLELKDEDEEGIGTKVSVIHHAPAFTGEEVIITGTITHMEHHEIICSYEAKAGRRLIASGETGQKILKREKFDRLFAHAKHKHRR